MSENNLPAEARALLDRLQQAEGVVEAAGAWHEVTLTKLMHGRANQAEIALEKALAAWEEGKG